MYLYITTSKSRKKMENFWYLDMSSQTKLEKLDQWIGGEYYIQTSLYNIIKYDNRFKVLEIDTITEEELFYFLNKSEKIIFPGSHKLEDKFNKYKHKILSYVYFEVSSDKYNGLQFINPWRYTNKNVFIPITPVELPLIENNYKPSFNDFNETGLLIGKCISHVVSKNKHKELNNLVDILPCKLFSTYRLLNKDNCPSYLGNHKDNCIKYSNCIINHTNINHIGVLNPIDFRLLLRKVKFVLFFNSAFAPPTLIEALHEKCIIISTRNVIPQDLCNNKNIYLIDNLSIDNISKLINDINCNNIKFDEKSYPTDYCIENKIKYIL
jgi:hypothetical protein